MDWATLVAAAGVSALVSLGAVRQVTVRQARAERAEAARVAVRAEVALLIDELARYRFQRSRSSPMRDAEMAEIGDHHTVVKIRAAAVDLPRWRRRRVDRRCRRVFGTSWTDLAIEYPTKATEAKESLSAWLAFAVEGSAAEDLGLMHRAYSELPGHLSQQELAAELRSLAASR